MLLSSPVQSLPSNSCATDLPRPRRFSRSPRTQSRLFYGANALSYFSLPHSRPSCCFDQAVETSNSLVELQQRVSSICCQRNEGDLNAITSLDRSPSSLLPILQLSARRRPIRSRCSLKSTRSRQLDYLSPTSYARTSVRQMLIRTVERFGSP